MWPRALKQTSLETNILIYSLALEILTFEEDDGAG
jgi:hypothetical protein